MGKQFLFKQGGKLTSRMAFSIHIEELCSVFVEDLFRALKWSLPELCRNELGQTRNHCA